MIAIYNGTLVNEGRSERGYILIEGKMIENICLGDLPQQLLDDPSLTKIDAGGGYIIPGVIDDQVHFREPGMTEKGDIQSESRAAVAGGVTSFMEMPNTKPASTTMELLEAKYERAAEVSPANYSFYLGATNSNIEVVRAIDPKRVCGVKLFMGSSTGNMLVDRRSALEAIFKESPVLITTHCEDEEMVSANLRWAFDKYGDNIPFELHPVIRSAEACYRSSALAVELASKSSADLHVLHLSTARELSLFGDGALEDKKITAEVCAHHLWFSDADYATKGAFIKCNPAIKTIDDREALREALRSGRIDVLATDHAPHTLEQKANPYTQSPSGLPLVQHSLAMMLTMPYTVEEVVKFMCHNPAVRFKVDRRGFLRKGYYADIAIVQPHEQTITSQSLYYKCGWSPITGETLSHTVSHTLVNGEVVYANGELTGKIAGERLTFDR
ncbi:MAG: dihydroorotase [Rikenellaceae bacterium]